MKADPVGLVEIARRLGVDDRTPIVWRKRGLMPEARWEVSGRPAWDWGTDIRPWAIKSGRLSEVSVR